MFSILLFISSAEKRSKVKRSFSINILPTFSTEWKSTFEKFDKKNSDAIVLIEQIRAEQELLTKVLGSENKLSRAIELARSGSSVDEIILATGINSDEAKAVVKFHGPGNSV